MFIFISLDEKESQQTSDTEEEGEDEAPTKLDVFERLEYDATSRQLRHDHNGSRKLDKQLIQVEIDNQSDSSFLTDPTVSNGLLLQTYLIIKIFWMIIHSFPLFQYFF